MSVAQRPDQAAIDEASNLLIDFMARLAVKVEEDTPADMVDRDKYAASIEVMTEKLLRLRAVVQWMLVDSDDVANAAVVTYLTELNKTHVILPREIDSGFYMRAGNVAVSNHGMDHLGKRRSGPRIGDMAAVDCFEVIVAEADRRAAESAKIADQ